MNFLGVSYFTNPSCLGGDLGVSNVDTVWELNIHNFTWDEVGQMTTPRAYHKGSVIGMTEDIVKNCG